MDLDGQNQAFSTGSLTLLGNGSGSGALINSAVGLDFAATLAGDVSSLATPASAAPVT